MFSQIQKKLYQSFINELLFCILGVGNVTAAAEFNFYCDPEAAYVTIHNMNCPITIFPWEAAYKYGRLTYVSTHIFLLQ